MIFIFVVTQLRNVAQIVDSFPGFAGDFIELWLRYAKAQQEVVYPTRQFVGTLERQSIFDARAANHYLQDRRPELYGPLHKP